MEVLMLTTLFPKAFHKHSALPLLGSIADNFDDWLFERGYTVASRTHASETLRRIDEDLRRRGMEDVKDLTHSILNRSWTALARTSLELLTFEKVYRGEKEKDVLNKNPRLLCEHTVQAMEGTFHREKWRYD